MACLLIDYENESGRVLEGISLLGLKRTDRIVIFYSRKAAKITMEFHKELEKIRAKKEYEIVETDCLNALDFQLSSFLGACINENPKEDYYIISKDKGFECVCNFWKNKGASVKRLDYIVNYINV